LYKKDQRHTLVNCHSLGDTVAICFALLSEQFLYYHQDVRR